MTRSERRMLGKLMFNAGVRLETMSWRNGFVEGLLSRERYYEPRWQKRWIRSYYIALANSVHMRKV